MSSSEDYVVWLDPKEASNLLDEQSFVFLLEGILLEGGIDAQGLKVRLG
jgi:hypothetical protein